MRKYIYMLLLVCVCSCSCLSQYRQILDSAENMIENNHADSAYQLLRPIHLENVKGAEQQARFALLYSQALDKNYIDVKDDSLALIAVDYYAKKGTAEQKAKAYYYLGRVYENAGDTEECIINLTAASECVPEASYYLKGLIYSHLANMQQQQSNFEKALSADSIALKIFERNGDKFNEAVIYSDMAVNLTMLRRHNEALQMSRSALSIYKELKDTVNILYQHIPILLNKEHLETPKDILKRELFQVVQQYNNGVVPESYYSYLTEIYAKLSQPDSAMYYLNKFENNNSLQHKASKSRKLYQIAKNSGNISDALKHYEELSIIEDSIYKQDKQQLVDAVSEKYKSQLYKSSLNEEKQRHKVSIIIIWLLFILLVASIVIIYCINRYVILKRLNEQRQQEAIVFRQQEQIATLEEAQYNMHKQYESLLSEVGSNDEVEIKAINKIEETVSHINNLLENVSISNQKPDKVLSTFVDAMRTTANDSSAYFHLRYIANKKYFGIINYLEKNYRLTHFEIDLCSMICLNFSNDAIRASLGHDNNRSIYNKRSKLKSSLGIEGNKHIEDFIKEKIELLSKACVN